MNSGCVGAQNATIDIDKINGKMLHNGMTRREFLESFCRKYSQEPVCYPEYEKRCILDIPYDNKSDCQRINIYLPDGNGLFPVIVWVHGGGWFMGSRSDFGLSIALNFIKYGYAVVSVGYRLAQEAIHPMPVQDVLKALDLIKSQASRYSLDTNHLGMMSGSAGAVIAVLAALHNNSITAVVLRCPILDFASIRKQYEKISLQRNRFDYPDEDTSIEALYLGGDIYEMREACAEVNPANHLTGVIPHFLLHHGLIDMDTPYLQSVEFAEKVCAVSCDDDRAKVILLENTGHDNGAFDLSSTFEQELAFFSQYLKTKRRAAYDLQGR
jgi:acetyl esterase/lipase